MAKNRTTLRALLQTKKTRAVIEDYLHKRLSRFLEEAVAHSLPLTVQAEREPLVYKALLLPEKEPLFPQLCLRKTSEGVDYQLVLQNTSEQWAIREKGFFPLTCGEPAWIVSGRHLYCIRGISGRMIRPFMGKDWIHVPSSQVKSFFQKFLLKAAAHADIVAEGFRVGTLSTFQGVYLEWVDSFLKGDTCRLRLLFDYGGKQVPYESRQERMASLVNDSTEALEIQIIQRNRTSERIFAARLCELGLLEENGLFHLPAGSAPSLTIDWLIAHRDALEKAGLQIKAPVVSGHCLVLLPHQIRLTSEAVGDWFDLQGEVQVGPYRIPFRELVSYLRSGNPYYPLEGGQYFRIPEEWFTRYSPLAQHLQVEEDRALRLPKSLFSLLPPDENRPCKPLLKESQDNAAYVPPPELKASLRPYQHYGVEWILSRLQQGFGACLADDMGLGKTLQAIAVLLHLKQESKRLQKPLTASRENPLEAFRQLSLFEVYQDELRPLQALVILPTSLVFNWRRELERFAPTLFVYAHVGHTRLRDTRAIAGHDVVLTTYHTARQDLALLSRLSWRVIVLDESQQIKNPRAEISKVVRSLRSEYRISLSGTPIENALADLWTQMAFLSPSALGSFRHFQENYIVPIEKRGEEAAKRRLFDMVRPFFLRRTKEEVAPELPALIEQVFYSEMLSEQRREYERIKAAARNEILALFDTPKTRARALRELTRLRQMANHPALVHPESRLPSGKFEDVLGQWDGIRRAGHKVLFFSSFEKHLRLFRAHFEASRYPFAWLTGETPEGERARQVERFQTMREVQALFMTFKAGGTGLNLTAADYIFILDPWWNPAVEQQAIARAHRIGQSRPVHVLRFVARESIEEKILDLQERKRQIGEQLFEEPTGWLALSREDVEQLLE